MYLKKTRSILLSFFILSTFILFSYTSDQKSNSSVENKQRSSVKITKVDDSTSKITISINLKSEEAIYSNSINVSTNNPNISLSQLQTNILPIKEYDPSFKEVSVFKNNFEINLTAKKTNSTLVNQQESELYINYLLNNKKDPVEEIIPIKLFEEKLIIDENKNETSTLKKEEKTNNLKENTENKLEDKNSQKSVWYYLEKLSSYTQNLLEQTDSNWLRIILVLILGLLMSFTPCIYPIIPITVGVLQSQGGRSVFYNFLLAMFYAFGVATTFALFGLTAAYTGFLFGQILTNPIFIILLSAMLIYLALSMFGVYEIYIPSFLQKSTNINHKGSIISAFAFGIVSGSVASPCLSPGLALLLTIVATIGSKLLGFILLFAFGIGLSIPLIVIGTFSGSINVLPRAGNWMIEVKKIFGFMLLAMSIYFIKNIIPPYLTLWITAFFVLGAGIFYIKTISEYETKTGKRIKNILGIGLIALSVLIFTKAVQKTFFYHPEQVIDIWQHDYQQALQDAKKMNKKLFIDIGAQFCTICKAIDKQIFSDSNVVNAMNKFVLVKVDATDSETEPYLTLRKKYNLLGVPAILLINPETGEIVKRWGSELYSKPKQEFIQELESFGESTNK